MDVLAEPLGDAHGASALPKAMPTVPKRPRQNPREMTNPWQTTRLFFKDGQVREQILGARPKHDIMATLRALLREE